MNRGPKVKTAQNSRKPKEKGVFAIEPKVPGYLSAEEKTEFLKLVGILRKAGTLDRTDPKLIELYTVNYSIMRSAQEDVRLNGPTMFNSSGTAMANPALLALDRCTLRLRAIIADMGLSPASSRHSHPDDSEQNRKDQWADVLSLSG